MIKKISSDYDIEDVKGIFPHGEEKEKEELSKVFRKEESVF